METIKINNHKAYITNVRNNASALRMELDTKVPLKYTRQPKYFSHMDNCIYHPTTGLIARQEVIHNVQKNYPSQFSKNLHYLRKLDGYEYLSGIIENRLNELYPQTKKIRKFLIENNHFSLYYVKSKQKLNFLAKVKLMLMR